MSKATYPLKLPLSVKRAAQRLTKEDGVSLNQWIAAAVAEKVGVVETAAEFFKECHGHRADEVFEERSQGSSAAGGRSPLSKTAV